MKVDKHLPDVICGRLEKKTKNFTLKKSTSELARKAIGALYEELGRDGEWQCFEREVGAVSEETIARGNPAKALSISTLISRRGKMLGKKGGGEKTADPITLSHITAIYDAFIGPPPAEVTDDCNKALPIQIHAMIVVASSLMLRFNELKGLLLQEAEIDFERSRAVFYLLKGSKNSWRRLALTLEEWPICSDPRASPLTALARWMRLRGKAYGPLFCAMGGKGKILSPSSPCKSSDLILQLRDMLRKAGFCSADCISTHSCRRGGAQFYALQGLRYDWIMKKGNWKDPIALQRYLAVNNRDTRIEFDSSMGEDMHRAVVPFRKQQDTITKILLLLESSKSSLMASPGLKKAIYELLI